MAGADSITVLDNAAFAKIKENARNSKARNLIHQDALNDSHIIAERQKDRGEFLRKSKTLKGDSFDAMEDSYSNKAARKVPSDEIGSEGMQRDQMLEQRLNELKNNVAKSNGSLGIMPKNTISNNSQPRASQFLPKEITESFKKNPIDNGLYGADETTENNDVKAVRNIIELTNGLSSRQIAKEEPQQTQINYETIKQIVETTVKKYAVALNKKIINEIKSNGNISDLKAMKIGDKFSFISENGDIYEAKLTFKGNVKDKMK